MGRKFDSNNVIYIFFNKMVGGLYSILIKNLFFRV